MPEKKANGSQINEQMLCQKLSRVDNREINASTLSTHVGLGGTTRLDWEGCKGLPKEESGGMDEPSDVFIESIESGFWLPFTPIFCIVRIFSRFSTEKGPFKPDRRGKINKTYLFALK